MIRQSTHAEPVYKAKQEPPLRVNWVSNRTSNAKKHPLTELSPVQMQNTPATQPILKLSAFQPVKEIYLGNHREIDLANPDSKATDRGSSKNTDRGRSQKSSCDRKQKLSLMSKRPSLRRITDFRTFKAIEDKTSISRPMSKHQTPKQQDEIIFPAKKEMEKVGNSKKCIRLSSKRSDLTQRPGV